MSAIFILILIFLIIYVPVCIYNTRVDLNARRINNLILFLLNSHLGIGISLLIAEVIRRCNFIGSLFVLIGRNSLGILIWHIPFSSIFYACLVPAMPQYVQNFVWGGEGLIIAIIILLIYDLTISIFFNKIILEKN